MLLLLLLPVLLRLLPFCYSCSFYSCNSSSFYYLYYAAVIVVVAATAVAAATTTTTTITITATDTHVRRQPSTKQRSALQSALWMRSSSFSTVRACAEEAGRTRDASSSRFLWVGGGGEKWRQQWHNHA